MPDDAARSTMAEDWHLDKKVPITLIGAILVQTFAFGVWAENLSIRLDSLERQTPSVASEFSKLETARESAALQLNTVQGDIKSLLELARRNDNRNVNKDTHLP